MNKRERLLAIKAAAMKMAAEVEWAAFLSAPPELEQMAYAVRRASIDMASVPDFHVSLRLAVADVCDLLFDYVEQLPCVQEIEQEAAGLLSSAIKRKIMESTRADATLGPLAQRLYEYPITVKFKSIPSPLTQAPSTARVPSMERQNRMAEMGIPCRPGSG